MKHHELLDKIYWYWRRDNRAADGLQPMVDYRRALLAVVELHKPFQFEQGPDEYKLVCSNCQHGAIGDVYPCETIQVIEKELV